LVAVNIRSLILFSHGISFGESEMSNSMILGTWD
jgi:hypothetical protein